MVYKQGKYEEARQLYQTTLERYEEALGQTHPKTLKVAKELAACIKLPDEQGDFEARELETYEEVSDENTAS